MDRGRLRRIEAAIRMQRAVVTWSEFNAAHERVGANIPHALTRAFIKIAADGGEPVPIGVLDRLAAHEANYPPEQQEADHRIIEAWRRQEGMPLIDGKAVRNRLAVRLEGLRTHPVGNQQAPGQPSLARWFEVYAEG